MVSSTTCVAFCLLLTSLLAVVSAMVDHLTLHDCMQNTTQEYGRIVSLTLDPYPPRLPGKLTVSATIELVQPVTGHVRMDLQIVRKLGFLGYALQIPCISHVGTCNYTDVCAMLKGEEPYVPTKPPTTTISPTSVATTNTNEAPVGTLDYSEGNSEPQAETDLTREMAAIFTRATASETTETVVVTKPSPGLEAGSSPDLSEQVPDDVQTTGQSEVKSAEPSVEEEADEVETAPTDSAAVVVPDGSQTPSQSPDAIIAVVATTPREPASTKASPGDDTATPFSAASTESDEPATTEPSPAGTPASETAVSLDVSSTAEPVVSAETAWTTERPCPDIMRQNNLPCACPFMPGSYTLPPTSFDIPDLGALSSLARGDYRVRLRFFDMDTGKMLACQQVETTLAGPCTDCVVG